MIIMILKTNFHNHFKQIIIIIIIISTIIRRRIIIINDDDSDDYNDIFKITINKCIQTNKQANKLFITSIYCTFLSFAYFISKEVFKKLATISASFLD